MRNVEARMLNADDVRIESLLEELKHIHLTHSLERFFQVLDEIVDHGREKIREVDDPDEQERLRENYRRVVEFAMDLALGVQA